MSLIRNMRQASTLALAAGVFALLGSTQPAGAQLEPRAGYTMAELSRFYVALLAEQNAQASAQYASGSGVSSSSQNTSQASNQSGDIPSAWWPTALCEEGGRNDPYAGYFGILEWNGFDGYPSAGAAPLSVQLAWEQANGITQPPDAPGQCHSY